MFMQFVLAKSIPYKYWRMDGWMDICISNSVIHTVGLRCNIVYVSCFDSLCLIGRSEEAHHNDLIWTPHHTKRHMDFAQHIILEMICSPSLSLIFARASFVPAIAGFIPVHLAQQQPLYNVCLLCLHAVSAFYFYMVCVRYKKHGSSNAKNHTLEMHTNPYTCTYLY